jgi:DNA-binding protein HU-beta
MRLLDSYRYGSYKPGGVALQSRVVANGELERPNVNKGGIMNKSDLIEAMAEAADISKSAAGRALDGLTDAIAVALKNGENVSLIGFGTFAVKERAARTGRNPQTGATIKIKASKSPSFKAGKALKDAVQ